MEVDDPLVPPGRDGQFQAIGAEGQAPRPAELAKDANLTDTVKAQMEGACIYAMSACFFGEITGKQGRIQQHNFDDYPVARMDTAPRAVEVHVVESEEPPGGAGEPGVPPFAPALCNAIFNAIGKRIRALPIVHTDLSAT